MKNYINRPTKIVIYILLWGVSFLNHACMDKFLEERYNYSQVIPQTLSDYQAIMDNSTLMNLYAGNDITLISADELYIRDAVYNSIRSTTDKNAYVWNKDIFGLDDVKDWDYAYKRILHSNIVIDGLSKNKFENEDKNKVNAVLGTAYFIRAYAHFELSQVFCKQYDINTSGTDLGIPLRLEYDVNIIAKRSTVEDVYKHVIEDLKKAIELLPSSTLVKERPNTAAALTLLARVYLQQENYEEAYRYSKLGLKEKDTLLDFNALSNLGKVKPNGSYYTFDGMRQTHPEILFMFRTVGGSVIKNYIGGNLTIDTVLLSSYDVADLRSKAFFYKNGDTDVFIGVYTGEPTLFSGIATDELYLIFSEAACRLGLLEESLSNLNTLLAHRFDKSFKPLSITNKQDLLVKVLDERRKELIFRGMRWSDLRRLNKDPYFTKTLYRKLNNQTFELKPNNNRYVLPLPNSSVLQSGLENNERE